MRVTVCPPPESNWSKFVIHREFTPQSSREIFDWCKQLDGDAGRYCGYLNNHKSMTVHIKDPDQALMFRLRWT